jgi:predicted amidohydrolase
MARRVTVAAVQLSAEVAGETNAEKRHHSLLAAERGLDEAGVRGADIACVGEMFNVRHQVLTPETLVAAAAGAVEETVGRLGAVARRHGMAVVAPVLGLLDGLPRNVALVLDRRGKLVGSYCKVHCTEGERRLGVVPGEAWPVFELDFGCIGVQICHDNSFPESARCLALSGAEILFWPHVMGGWGGEFMEVLLRSPAIHNGVYHVPVCFGCPPDRAWRPGMLIGRSSIIGPDATIVADAGRHVGLALARLDLDAPRLAADFTRPGDYVWWVDMRNDRRPHLYTPIVQPWAGIPPIPAADFAPRQSDSP